MISNENLRSLSRESDATHCLTLTSPEGATAQIHPYGAQVTSWKPAGGAERLFLSAASEFRPGAAIRGGVPVIFPQFGGSGLLPKHGFARLCHWDPAPFKTGPDFATAKFTLGDREATRQLWPHAFRAELRVTVGGARLELMFSVMNTGNEPFNFTAALHTYLQVADLLTTTVEGLAGARYHDTAVRPWSEGVQAEPHVRFPAEVDRIYYAAPGPLRVRTPEHVTQVKSDDFPDVVLWNPGPVKSANLPDMEAGGYRRFVCVEAAVVEQPPRLKPGDSWQGTQTLIAEGINAEHQGI